MKVVINKCQGGFGFSQQALKELESRGLKGKLNMHYSKDRTLRVDPRVIEVVEEMGPEADGTYANLKVVDIPFDSLEGWSIWNEYGVESIHETHRSRE